MRFLALAVLVAGLGWLTWPGQPAQAHPFDADFYSSRAELFADAEGVRVVVSVEVPSRRVLEQFLELYGDPSALDERSDQLFRQRQFDLMAEQLRLFRGGRSLPGVWRPVESEANGRGTETFFIYQLEFVPAQESAFALAKPGERLELRLEMEVFPREFIYLSASTAISPPWRLVESSADSILAAADQDLFDPATGRWSVDPRLRRLRWVLEKVESGE